MTKNYAAAICCGMSCIEHLDSKVDGSGSCRRRRIEGMKAEKFDFPASLEPKALSPVQTRVPKQRLSKL